MEATHIHSSAGHPTNTCPVSTVYRLYRTTDSLLHWVLDSGKGYVACMVNNELPRHSDKHGKGEFAKATVIYQGSVVGQGEVCPVQAKLEAMKQIPVAASKKELMWEKERRNN